MTELIKLFLNELFSTVKYENGSVKFNKTEDETKEKKRKKKALFYFLEIYFYRIWNRKQRMRGICKNKNKKREPAASRAILLYFCVF
jgi:hypothetical protein